MIAPRHGDRKSPAVNALRSRPRARLGGYHTQHRGTSSCAEGIGCRRKSARTDIAPLTKGPAGAWGVFAMALKHEANALLKDFEQLGRCFITPTGPNEPDGDQCREQDQSGGQPERPMQPGEK